MTARTTPCADCHRHDTCQQGHCTDPRVRVRRILVRHLSETPYVRAPFVERLTGLLVELDPYIGAPDPQHPDLPPPPRLRDRELTALRVVAAGGGYSDIAAHLQVPASTVKSLMHRLLPKLDAANSAHAVAIALRTGLLR